MTCPACTAAQQQPRSAWYRWKNANLEVRGCDVHLREVFEALSEAQANGSRHEELKRDWAEAMVYAGRLNAAVEALLALRDDHDPSSVDGCRCEGCRVANGAMRAALAGGET